MNSLNRDRKIDDRFCKTIEKATDNEGCIDLGIMLENLHSELEKVRQETIEICKERVSKAIYQQGILSVTEASEILSVINKKEQ